MNDILNNMGEYIKEYGLKIAFVVCIIVVGILLTWLLSFILKKILYKTKVDGAVSTFVVSIFKVLMAALIVLVVAAVLELSANSLLVSMSTVALAVGLALKDSFSNLANGILIIANKPFKRGDYISVAGIEGKAQNIKLLTVELVTFDNTKIVLPNSAVLNGNVINYSALPIRRVDLTFGVAYGSDMDKVESTLKRVAAEHPKILNSMDPVVFMQSHDDSAIIYAMKVWTNTVDYFTVKNALPRLVYDAFQRENIEIPFNQLDVHFDKTEIK